MNDLHKNLHHLMSIYGAPGIDVDVAVADIEKVYADDQHARAFEEKLNEAVMETIWIRAIEKSEQKKVHPKWFIANGQMFTFGIDVDRIKQLMKDAVRLGNNYGEHLEEAK